MNDFLFCLLFFIALTVLKFVKFKNTDYKNMSKCRYLGTILNMGNEGKYLLYLHLNRINCGKKILVDLNIPDQKGASSEIDLIMIHKTGIYVFESKNYSGWISGDEKSKIWTQTLKNKQKYGFYNPIDINDEHIKALLHRYPTTKESWYKSYIVFGYRCEFKKMNIVSKDVTVLKIQSLASAVSHDIASMPRIISDSDINNLYNSMKKYSNADSEGERSKFRTN